MLSNKHRKTLERLFAAPTLSNIKFGDIEALVRALGGEVRGGDALGLPSNLVAELGPICIALILEIRRNGTRSSRFGSGCARKE